MWMFYFKFNLFRFHQRHDLYIYFDDDTNKYTNESFELILENTHIYIHHKLKITSIEKYQ